MHLCLWQGSRLTERGETRPALFSQGCMAQTLCVLTSSNTCTTLLLACFCTFKTASCLGVSREVAPGSQKHERTLDGTNGQHGRKRRTDARRALYVAFRLVSFQAWVCVRASVPPGRRKRVLLRQDATLLDSGPLAISQRWETVKPDG